MDARHARHLYATVAVPCLETLWLEQECRDVMYQDRQRFDRQGRNGRSFGNMCSCDWWTSSLNEGV